jgi:hypothetical protein
MATFVVFIREKTRDQAEMDAYTPKAEASLAGHPITIHAAYGRQEVLEGPEVEGVVIVSFPSFEDSSRPKTIKSMTFHKSFRENGLNLSSPPRLSAA